jgi:hypothetical protein
MKPFTWRPGAPLTPIPGREVKRGRKPRKAAPAIVSDRLDTRSTAGPGDLSIEPMSVPMFGRAECEFEALNAEIARRGPTFEVDKAGRCMVCGIFGCSWWAAFCAWRAGQGERPNWRDGSIDATCSEVGAQLLLEAKERA